MTEEYFEYHVNEESEDESESDDEPCEFENYGPEQVTEDVNFVNLPPAAKIPKIEQRNWIGGTFDPQLFPFDEKDSGISPRIAETNRYHYSIPIANNSDKRKHQKEWEPVNREELYYFLAVVIMMSVIKKATLKSYWSTDPLLATPIFADIMPRDRFLEILRSLHFNNNDEQPVGDRLFKIEPVIGILKEKFQQFVIPYQNLCIDESLMLWKGRLAFKQYIPKKTAPFRC